ncbi:trehalose-phosphatase [[Candida] jaroonii]|uniref:Trehalose-phosphatase n=1 Tax=[Candida] jaroonii TaxID=467808 RepID=A0ACA9YD38_9ASCO|nr:trehalose-phosphatase [[Candida] jaroonii]
MEQLFALPDTIVSPSNYDKSDINLSGRILNVMTNIPNQIFKNYNDEWDVEPIRGNSSLYSSYFFLNQHSDWESHLIGWTGELVNKQNGRNYVASDNIKEDPLYLSEQDKSVIEDKIRKINKTDNIHPIWLLRRDQERWRRYAENYLWPVFHYIQSQPTDGKKESDGWYDYVKFNESYLQKIKSIYKPGDIIWIHDYNLLLLPQLLRMEFPDAFIGFFLHVPFPSSEYFRCIPKRSQLLDGMLGSDRIVFQSDSFQRHFISCCARVLGCEIKNHSVLAYGSSIETSVLPIGIDTKKIELDSFNSTIDEKINALREIYSDKKIIVGRDRLDSVRGVVQKLQAFEMFLQMFPEWRDQVVLIQVSSPTFSSHALKVEKKVSELINQINGTYGTLNHTPVLHYQIRINKDEYLALLRVADLALVTSVRDGMNTTALEYVVSQKENYSPLILSEFTGTASVLSDAILINPWDSVGIARTINQCLLMSKDDKKALQKKLYNKVCQNTIQNWTDNFLSGLINQLAHTHKSSYTPALNRPNLLNHYNKSHRRLFLFDYDGTLTPIVTDPEAAIPSKRLDSIIDSLSADPKNQIWLISGRDQRFLSKWFGHKHVGLSAEHGCFMKDIGSEDWVNLSESFDMSWQKEVEDIFKDFTDQTPNSNIEKKKVALVWHYRRADPELGIYQSEKLMEHLKATVGEKYDIEIMAGKANIEVRPKFVNKGEIVKRLVLHPHGSKQLPKPITDHNYDLESDKVPDFILCLGDDLTDEDMFKSLKQIETNWNLKNFPKNSFGAYGVYPVAVGPPTKQTIATSHLSDPSQVLETLGLLTGHVSLFESAGSVELDDRGHVENSESSISSKARAAKMIKDKSI